MVVGVGRWVVIRGGGCGQVGCDVVVGVGRWVVIWWWVWAGWL